MNFAGSGFVERAKQKSQKFKARFWQKWSFFIFCVFFWDIAQHCPFLKIKKGAAKWVKISKFSNFSINPKKNEDLARKPRKVTFQQFSKRLPVNLVGAQKKGQKTWFSPCWLIFCSTRPAKFGPFLAIFRDLFIFSKKRSSFATVHKIAFSQK